MTREPESGRRSAEEADLSPAAIRQRLDEVAQLYELGLYLTQAKPLPICVNGTQPAERRSGTVEGSDK